jgi:hypothetical protein
MASSQNFEKKLKKLYNEIKEGGYIIIEDMQKSLFSKFKLFEINSF